RGGWLDSHQERVMRSFLKLSALIIGTSLVIGSQVLSGAPITETQPNPNRHAIVQVVKKTRRRSDLPGISEAVPSEPAPRRTGFRQHLFWFIQSLNQQIGHGQWAMAIRRSHLFRDNPGPRPPRQEELVQGHYRIRERRRRIHPCRHD
ncbi:MAG: hypothetical protein AAF514_07185, partial [Verrucomicrobiota bacterium]